jgi:membrane protease YdiL (CAAX protease family)
LATSDTALWPVLRVALLATGAVTVLARVLPETWAATGVSACFFALCYALVLRDEPSTAAQFGMRLGGLFEPAPLNLRQMLRETSRALAWALLLGLLCFPLFWLGYVAWWSPEQAFRSTVHAGLLEDIMGQLVVIALPEEMFYRGYLQTALDRARPTRVRILGADLGIGVVLSSAIFALGHLATQLDPARLSVFFPSLLFGWLRARTGGIGASVFFHALCNLFAAYLARSYGLLP